MSELSRNDDRARSVVPQQPLPSGAVAARHARQAKARPTGAIFGLIGGILAVVLLSTAAVGGVVANTLNDQIQQNVVAISETDAPPPDIGAIDGGFNIAIIGSDRRDERSQQLGGTAALDEGGVLNDVNILVHVAQDQQSAVVISFPRDLEVALPECARWFGYYNKINTSIAQDVLQEGGTGLPCAVETIQILTGLPVHFAGMITFAGVVGMADAVGGVEVCTTAPIFDENTDLNLPTAGNHILTGYGALAFLRSRSAIGDGSDLGRVSSQQVYLSSLVRKLKSEGTLSDPTKLFPLATAALQNMTLSQSLADPYTMVQLALALKSIPLNRVTFVQWPTYYIGNGNVGTTQWAADQLLSYVYADQPFRLVAAGDDRGSTANTGADTSVVADDVVDNSALPVAEGVTGQTAADFTCSVPN